MRQCDPGMIDLTKSGETLNIDEVLDDLSNTGIQGEQ